MSSGKLNIGLIDLMDASNAVQYQAMALSCHDSFTVKSVGGSFFVFGVC